MHILLATDGSETAGLAQQHILALPWPTPVHVTVMTAMEAPHPPFTSLTPEAHGAYTSAVGVLRQNVEGKAADVVITDIPDYRHIVYRLGHNPVWMTIYGGRVVHRQF